MEGHFMFHWGGGLFFRWGGIFNWGGVPSHGGGFEKNCWMGGGPYEKPGNPLLKRVCCNRWKELMIMLVHSCI